MQRNYPQARRQLTAIVRQTLLEQHPLAALVAKIVSVREVFTESHCGILGRPEMSRHARKLLKPRTSWDVQGQGQLFTEY
jgi:hypothetical protein